MSDINDQTRFNQLYQAYLNELTLQGKSPKTVDMYSRCIRQVSVFFDTCPDALTAAELKVYFLSLVTVYQATHCKILSLSLGAMLILKAKMDDVEFVMNSIVGLLPFLNA